MRKSLPVAVLVLSGWEILRQPPAALDLLALSAGMAFALNNITCRAAQAVPVTSKSAINFLGGESLAANEWAGGALILFAAMLESRRREEHLEPVIPSVAERV